MLKLQRRRDVEFDAYHVRSGGFLLGGIQHQDHAPSKSWVWSIGNVDLNADGRGPAHGSGRDLDEAKAMLARRWRLWLSLAGLSEGAGDGPPRDPTPLILHPREGGRSEDYTVVTAGVGLGLVGRTYGVDTSRWHWSFSSVYDPEHGGARCGGGLTRDEALARFIEAWRAWLTLAALQGGGSSPEGTMVIDDVNRA
ncbi:hypothetical protein ACO2RV_04460 [Ancylobacter sp. VNQ12]|uniref:hypothetical protein n=1 Tax=Ancylobacter sp. VNQ12 TaxID=3400920 RepID=UPI003C0A9E9D